MRRYLLATCLAGLIIATAAHAQVLLPDADTRPNLGLNPTIKKQTVKPKPKQTAPTPLPSRTTQQPTRVPQSVIQRFQPPEVPKVTADSDKFTPRKIDAPTDSKSIISRIADFGENIPKSMKKLLPSGFSMPNNLERIMSQGMNRPEVRDLQDQFQISGAGSKSSINITPGGIVPQKGMTAEERFVAEKGLTMPNLPPEQQRVIEQMNAKREADIRAIQTRSAHFSNHQPLMAPIVDEQNKRLTLSSSANYMWGERDIKNIKRLLGYERHEIPQKCQIMHTIMLESDDKKYSKSQAELWTGRMSEIRYAGRVTAAGVMSMAVCYPPATLPNLGGIIKRVADKYGVQLSTAKKCTPPADLVYQTSLAIQYNGNGKVSCSFK